ncbi:serine/threonine-protein kinase VRK1 isoform X2 [Hemicordylus capensis]|uniref:serine/threonine-protein kinase VRK1 isoform X2 n=1 Tax=Hemicordylus capensis TaxID=884348 RepID=UPI002302C395|nr:serine/threonine-protein kinase VRK1 isoform X2 [Hemicordylus capensis]
MGCGVARRREPPLPWRARAREKAIDWLAGRRAASWPVLLIAPREVQSGLKEGASLNRRGVNMPNVKKAAAKRGPPKRKLADEFPPGEVFTDLAKKDWKLGPVIGKGGFGCLYLADVNSSKAVSNDAPYVMKVEPSENGPLFTELRFYMRAAKPDLIKKWISSHKLKYLGVPRYWGSGLHQKNGKSYRFMVMDRFGKDLQKIFEERGKPFSLRTVLQLGLRILDILEYIHEHEYVHGDIKASNLLLSYKTPHQVYLVDYGLAYRYCPEGTHKDYKEDPKRCHDGTLEYTSIDAHKGVAPSRRGDLEILGYCMISWLCGNLPWEDNLKDPNYVRDSKIRYTDNIAELMSRCFSGKDKPGELARYMEKVMSLAYTEKPPYQELREILLQGLKNIGQKDDGILDFGVLENGEVPVKPALKTKRKLPAATGSATDDEDDAETVTEDVKNIKKQKRTASKTGATKPKLQKMSPKAKTSSKPRKRVLK